MSASFYDLLKYTATGIASPDMTYYDKMRASTLMGGVVHTLTGQPPLSFKANGTPLISWSMKGNGQQQGTPTPDNPIQPEFVGTKTGNLFDKSKTAQGKQWNSSGELVPASSNIWHATDFIAVDSSKSYIRSSNGVGVGNTFFEFDESKEFIRSAQSGTGNPIQPSSSCKYITFNIDSVNNPLDTYMLTQGTTAPTTYEPHGYKIPISCAGQTTSVYLGQVSTVRRIKKLVLDGTENWSTEPIAGIRRAYMQLPDQVIPNIGLSTHYIVQSGKYEDGYCNVNATGLLFIYSSVYASGTAAFKAYLAAQYAAGTPVTVWYVLATPENAIVNEPLAKIGDYADELHSTDAGVTIPTVKGQNTLTVDTELQPSEMSITYRG